MTTRLSYLLNPFLLATALTNEISFFLYINQFGSISTSFWRYPLKSVRRKALGWISYLILALVVCLAVWHSHCPGHVHCFVNVLWWACSSLNPLLCLRFRLRKSGANWSAIGLCCVTTTWQQIFEDAHALQVTGGRRFAACNYWYSWTQTTWQVMQWDMQWLLIAVSYVGLYQWWANCGSSKQFVWLF